MWNQFENKPGEIIKKTETTDYRRVFDYGDYYVKVLASDWWMMQNCNPESIEDLEVRVSELQSFFDWLCKPEIFGEYLVPCTFDLVIPPDSKRPEIAVIQNKIEGEILSKSFNSSYYKFFNKVYEEIKNKLLLLLITRKVPEEFIPFLNKTYYTNQFNLTHPDFAEDNVIVKEEDAKLRLYWFDF